MKFENGPHDKRATLVPNSRGYAADRKTPSPLQEAVGGKNQKQANKRSHQIRVRGSLNIEAMAVRLKQQ